MCKTLVRRAELEEKLRKSSSTRERKLGWMSNNVFGIATKANVRICRKEAYNKGISR